MSVFMFFISTISVWLFPIAYMYAEITLHVVHLFDWNFYHINHSYFKFLIFLVQTSELYLSPFFFFDYFVSCQCFFLVSFYALFKAGHLLKTMKTEINRFYVWK